MKLLSSLVTHIIEEYIIIPKYKLNPLVSEKTKIIDNVSFSNPALNLLHTNIILNTLQNDMINNYIEIILSGCILVIPLKKILSKFNNIGDKRKISIDIIAFIKNKFNTSNIIFIKILWRYLNKTMKISYSNIIVTARTLKNINKLMINLDKKKCNCGFEDCNYEYKINKWSSICQSNCNYAVDIILNNLDNIDINLLLRNNNPRIVKLIKENIDKINSFTCVVNSKNYDSLKTIVFQNLDKMNEYSLQIVMEDPDFVNYAMENYVTGLNTLNTLKNNKNKRIVELFIKYGLSLQSLIHNPNIWINQKMYHKKNIINGF